MRSKTIKFILVFFNIVMLSSLGWSQCEGCIENMSGYWNSDSLGWTDCINWVTNMENCNEGDISFLQEVTDSINSLVNESFIEPLQLGSQYWNNGRLEYLSLVFFPIDSTLSDIYSTQISLQLPKSIGNLTNLRYLNIMGHFTGEIPIEIGNLINLEKFYSDWFTHFGCYEFDYECRSLIENYGDIHSHECCIINCNSTDNCNGEIPSEIGNLTKLTDLSLGDNDLSGEIPSEIGNLSQLNSLSLYGNQLSGEFPSEIGNLTNLKYLDLHSNEFSGVIPTNFENLTNLNWVNLNENHLCPPYPNNLSPSYVGYQIIEECDYSIECEEGFVEYKGFCYYQSDLDVLQSCIDNSGSTLNMNMDVDGSGIIEPLELCSQDWENGRITLLHCYNKLTGEIPVEIGDLTNLTTLSLNSNQLTGEIPSWIGNLTSLTTLSLNSNQLTGEIPSWIGNLTNLTSLYLYDNQLTGEIPTEIGNLTNLTTLYLYDNQLTGEIPSEIGNLTNLTWLYSYDNQLSGEIPSEIGQLTNLTFLYLYDNQLTGEIPSEIGQLTNLTHLNLGVNQLTGEIPSEIGNLTNLTFLNLSYNELTGEIPVEIGNLTSLTSLKLGVNKLTGEIPSEIGNLINLESLSLDNNQLTGQIPQEIGNLTNLTVLSLGYNQLSGEIPSEIGDLTNLTDYLSLHFNQLSGEIPPEIGDLTNLRELGLDNNQLSGEIPSEIGNLDNLELLWLSNNQLEGFIPESICDLSILWDQYNEWGDSTFHIYNNSLCPPYPDCIEEYIGGQDTTGCPPLSITDNLIPTTYTLSSPYPNPFNPTTTISISIPQSDMVSLKVYDITGKLVTTLINEQLNIGYHSIDWDGTNQSSGMYFVRMESGDYVETQKLLLVK